MRKFKLTPLQNRIVWILEEAWEETTETIRATLRSKGSLDEEALRSALDGLQRVGFVEVAETCVVLTERGRSALAE